MDFLTIGMVRGESQFTVSEMFALIWDCCLVKSIYRGELRGKNLVYC